MLIMFWITFNNRTRIRIYSMNPNPDHLEYMNPDHLESINPDANQFESVNLYRLESRNPDPDYLESMNHYFLLIFFKVLYSLYYYTYYPFLYTCLIMEDDIGVCVVPYSCITQGIHEKERQKIRQRSSLLFGGTE